MEQTLTNIVIGGIILLAAIVIYDIYEILTDNSPRKN